jgi:ketosteroid isomerase-like protein
MKHIVILLTLALVAAQEVTTQNLTPALNEMVSTERAFAQASADKGTRDAFLAFIADDGILFRPTAVKGKEWMLSHPLPPSPKRQLLSWQPIFADIAQSEDIGYTTGPWQFRPDINNEKASAFGNFITVWKKQADGSWKFAVDLGISHPEPTETPKAWQPPAEVALKSRKDQLKHSNDQLSQLELTISETCARLGARACFTEHMADEVRLFRENSLPFVGAAAAAKGLTDEKWSWHPAATNISSSKDLGYTYGTYELSQGKSATERGNYLRIWKRKNGKWKVVVDVANPLPEEKKN